MRHVAVLALVFTSGCSLLWSMDSYEGGSAVSTPDGGVGNVDPGRKEAGAPDGSSGSPTDSGVVDTGVDSAPTCHDEVEPNDVQANAHELETGETCGTVVDVEDQDQFKVTTTNAVDVTITIPASLMVIWYGQTDSDVIDTPGSSKLTLQPGTNRLMFQSKGAGGGDYSIIR